MKKGFWIWNIPNCEKGDPLAIAAEAARAGLTDVFVKVVDGSLPFNVQAGKDLLPPVVEALRAMGVRAWGWQYVYGANPKVEAQMALKRIRDLKLDGFVVDAEKEFKEGNGGAKARVYLEELKNGFSGDLAFSSYRFPHYHREFPWDVFFLYCQINMPQVYWEQATNAGQQLELCVQKFTGMNPSMPVMPIGAAYKWNGWRPTLAQVQDFTATAEKLNLPLISFWSWEHCRRDLPELWPQPVIATPPPIGDRLALIEKKVQVLDSALAGLAKAVADLKAVLN